MQLCMPKFVSYSKCLSIGGIMPIYVDGIIPQIEKPRNLGKFFRKFGKYNRYAIGLGDLKGQNRRRRYDALLQKFLGRTLGKPIVGRRAPQVLLYVSVHIRF